MNADQYKQIDKAAAHAHHMWANGEHNWNQIIADVQPILQIPSDDKKKVEQLEVQLAGCLSAAEGWTSDADATPGMFGWSTSYQAVVKLRKKFEALLKELGPTDEQKVEAIIAKQHPVRCLEDRIVSQRMAAEIVDALKK